MLGKFEAAAEPNPAAEGSAASQSRQAGAARITGRRARVNRPLPIWTTTALREGA